MCAPWARALSARGDVHDCQAPESSLHSNVEPASLDENANEAAADAVGPLGPEPIVVSGATVSTVQVRAASVASMLPAASVARTRKVWSPCARPVSARGEVQVCQAPESSLHSNVAPVSSEAKPKLAEVEAVGPLGPESIVVSGATVSTVQVRAASVASVLPAASVARTRKRVRALREPGERARRGAGLPGAGVELALEGRARLGGERRCSRTWRR